MTPTTPATPPAWRGWYRPHRRARWRRLAEAADYGACWGKLLDRLPPGPGGESVVVAAGTDPNVTAAGRRP